MEATVITELLVNNLQNIEFNHTIELKDKLDNILYNSNLFKQKIDSYRQNLENIDSFNSRYNYLYSLLLEIDKISLESIKNENIQSKIGNFQKLHLIFDKYPIFDDSIFFLQSYNQLNEFCIQGINLNNFDKDFFINFKKLLYLNLIASSRDNYTENSNFSAANLEFIKPLSQLKFLGIQYQNIKDTEPLTYLNQLIGLALISTNISNLSFLEEKNKLELLYLESNNISNIDIISNLTNLKELNLKNNKITDINSLSHLTKLEILDLSNNDICHFDALKNLISLKELHITSKINNMDFLTNLKKLESLTLFNLNQESLSLLEKLPKIESLILHDLSYNDLSIFNNFKSLKNLEFKNITFSDNDLLILKNLPIPRIGIDNYSYGEGSIYSLSEIKNHNLKIN